MKIQSLIFNEIKMLFFICCFNVFGLAAFAQVQLFPVVNIPVFEGSNELFNAWCGGFNSPQFSPINLDDSGKIDLFVFDRNGIISIPFKYDQTALGSGFRYAPQYQVNFPAMSNFSLVRDYNKDGVPDLFTHTSAGMKVYRGVVVNGYTKYVLEKSILEFGSTNTNIWVNADDIPAVVDVNMDGDLDVLSFGIFFILSLEIKVTQKKRLI